MFNLDGLRKRHVQSGQTRTGGRPRRSPGRPGVEALEGRLLLASDPTVSFHVVNDWGGGFQAELAITNTQRTPIDGWTVAYDFAPAIDTVWNATILSHQGSRYVLQDAGY